jgi:membrane associated rhomboid family serine protease
MIEQDSLLTQSEIENPDDVDEQYQRLEEEKKSARKSAIQTVSGGLGLIALSIAIVVIWDMGWDSLFRNVFFFIGGIILVLGAYGLYEARTLTLEKITPDPQALEFEKQVAAKKPTYLIMMTGCLITVFLFQALQLKSSVEAAGLVKSNVWNGEIWRLFTCVTLHGSVWHIWMNSSAFWSFGKLVRTVSDRAYLPLVFLLSALSGSLFSLILLPNSTSVGASGGLMGYTGFLFVAGLRRKEALPKGFFKSILFNLFFIAAVGLVGFAFIDNAAHFGGLIAGAACGMIFIKKDEKTIPIKATKAVEITGLVVMLLIIVISIFSIAKIIKATIER